MLPGQYEGREGQEGEIIKVYEEPVGMMDMFVILMLLMVFQRYVIIYQAAYLTYVQFNVYQLYHHITIKHTHLHTN